MDENVSDVGAIADPRFSRAEALKLPQLMTMLGYLHKTYGIPKYGWKNRDLRYHYTDAPGLLGIITSNRLWATDSRFLNDPSEGRFLPQKLIDLMSVKCETATQRATIDKIQWCLAHPRSTTATFSVSFCADGDLLSQWRGYGKFGAGYAIGMEIHEAPHAQLGLLYDVCYGEQQLEQIAADFLDIYDTASKAWGDHMMESICEQAAIVLNALASSFKDPSYAAEQESRIVVPYSNRPDYLFEREAPLHFRPRGGDVVPYIPLALDLLRDNNQAPKLPIKQIVMGPGVEHERNRIALNLLLERNGYNNVDITASVAPFKP